MYFILSHPFLRYWPKHVLHRKAIIMLKINICIIKNVHAHLKLWELCMPIVVFVYIYLLYLLKLLEYMMMHRDYMLIYLSSARGHNITLFQKVIKNSTNLKIYVSNEK